MSSPSLIPSSPSPSSPPSFMERIKSLNYRDPNVLFLLTWIVSSALAVLVPVLNWRSKRLEYYESYGYYVEYENQQREYEEEQKQQQDNGNDNNNGDGDYYYKQCSWFNWPCRKQQYYYASLGDGNGDNGNNNDGGAEKLPNWYVFLGGETEELRRWREENSGGREGGAGGGGRSSSDKSVAETFVYVWTLLIFVMLVAYGAYALRKRQPATAIVVFLILVGQFCFLQLVLLAQGVILSDERDLEDSVYGWYGQPAVLLAYTDFGILLFCVGFTIAFIVKACVLNGERKAGADEAGAGGLLSSKEGNKDSNNASSSSEAAARIGVDGTGRGSDDEYHMCDDDVPGAGMISA